MRAPAFTTVPASMKQGPSTVAPSSIFTSAPRHVKPRASAPNGSARKRRSMMSRCTCMYFSGVPMSIQ